MVAVLPGKIGVPIFSILKAQAKPKHVVFLEGDNEKIQRACHSILEEAFGSRALSNPFSFSGDCAQNLGSIQGLVPTKNSPGLAAGDHYVLHTLNRFHVLRARVFRPRRCRQVAAVNRRTSGESAAGMDLQERRILQSGAAAKAETHP